MTTAETQYCRLSTQAPADALLLLLTRARDRALASTPSGVNLADVSGRPMTDVEISRPHGDAVTRVVAVRTPA